MVVSPSCQSDATSVNNSRLTRLLRGACKVCTGDHNAYDLGIRHLIGVAQRSWVANALVWCPAAVCAPCFYLLCYLCIHTVPQSSLGFIMTKRSSALNSSCAQLAFKQNSKHTTSPMTGGPQMCTSVANECSILDTRPGRHKHNAYVADHSRASITEHCAWTTHAFVLACHCLQLRRAGSSQTNLILSDQSLLVQLRVCSILLIHSWSILCTVSSIIACSAGVASQSLLLSRL